MRQNGFAQILVLALLLLGVGMGAVLVQKPNILKSRADSNCSWNEWNLTYNKCLGQTGFNSRYDFNKDNCVNGYDYGSFITCLYSQPQSTPTPTKPPAPKVPSGDPDLDVTYIGRDPHYSYESTKGWPSPGETVIFTAHIKNAGGNSSSSFAYRWYIDGNIVQTGNLPIPPSQEETTAMYNWTWQNGVHTVKFQSDPSNAITEVSEVNNEIEDRTNALSVGLWVEKTLYKWFNENQIKLDIGSNSWEDWAQRQIKDWNKVLAGSNYYPSVPQGIIDRVRLDKITVVEDGTITQSDVLPMRSDKTIDFQWGFATSLFNKPEHLYEKDMQPKLNPDITNPFYIEKSLSHELSHEWYLADDYNLDLDRRQCQVLKQDGTPLIPPGQVRRFSCGGGMMGCNAPVDKGEYYSEHAVFALNLIAGKRVETGMHVGGYLRDIPKNNNLRILGKNGQPLEGAAISLYQTVEDYSQSFSKIIDNTPDKTCTTNSQGLCPFYNYLWGGIHPNWNGAVMGVVVVKVTKNNQEDFAFIYLPEANLAYWKGNTQSATYDIKTDIDSTISSNITPTPIKSGPTPTPTLAPQQTITFTNLYPQSGTKVSSPVVFSGTVTDTVPWLGDRYIWLYIDGQKKEGGILYSRNSSSPYSIVNNPSSSPQNLTPGQHNWYAQIADQTGTVYINTATIYFTVSSSSTIPGSPPTPTPTKIAIPPKPAFKCENYSACNLTHNQPKKITYTDYFKALTCQNKTIYDSTWLGGSCSPFDIDGDKKISPDEARCFYSKVNQTCRP